MMGEFNENEVYDNSEFYNCVGEVKEWAYEHVFKANVQNSDKSEEDLANTFDGITYIIETLARMQFEYDKLYRDNKNLRSTLREMLAKTAENDKPTSTKKK